MNSLLQWLLRRQEHLTGKIAAADHGAASAAPPKGGPSGKPASGTARTTPDDPIARGRQLMDNGRHAEALGFFERALALQPSAAAYAGLGHCYLAMAKAQQAGDAFTKALELYGQSLRQNPTAADYMGQAGVYEAINETAAARDSFLEALKLDPAHAPSHMNLGNLYLRQRAYADAETSYRSALHARPNWAEACIGLACALEGQNLNDDAVAAYRRAIALEPGHMGAINNLNQLLLQCGRARESQEMLAAARRHLPAEPRLMKMQAGILTTFGQAEAVAALYREMLAQDPHNLEYFSSLLFTLNYVRSLSPAQVLEEHRRFGQLIADRVARIDAATEPVADRRLRIGYLSPDFRAHPMSCFIDPVLRHHDRNAFEVFCYYDYPSRDAITARLQASADHWRNVAGIEDEDLARGIAADRLDILIDLAGHSAHNRMGVFARRAAPLQYTWLGYLCTTGLPAMDYRLCDAKTDPPGVAEVWQTETPARLPDSQWCYAPQVDLPPAGGLPFRRNGYWTFGSFNQAAKLGAETLASWAGILKAFPDSRIRMLDIVDPALKDSILEQFTAAGIDAGRVHLQGRLPTTAYLAAHNEVDVCLDTFPYSGGTTTCDALIMGVPVLTSAGERAVSRSSLSLLTTLGLEDWIAPSAGQLAEVLQRQLAQPDRMEALRAELPARMQASPLMDAPRFMRHLEGLFREAWKQYCAKPRAAAG